MAAEGKDTTEFQLAKRSTWMSVGAIAVGAFLTAFQGGEPWYVAAAAALSAAVAWISASYSKSRAIAKAASPT